MTKAKAKAKEKPTGLDLLRAPFADNQISKLPKPTKKQTEAVRANYKEGIRCGECGGWHHPKVVHLDYVGHAALTDRLLDADPSWNWEPLAFTEQGLPAFDGTNGGLWIKLTVCKQTRLGYGHAKDKQMDPGAREKEVIGDALRNAAMRFGAALDLWHKGQLHTDDDAPEVQEHSPDTGGGAGGAGVVVTPDFGNNDQSPSKTWASSFKDKMGKCTSMDKLIETWQSNADNLRALPEDIFKELTAAKDTRKAALESQQGETNDG